jgi:8-oxo-dGTP diphosphatase
MRSSLYNGLTASFYFDSMQVVAAIIVRDESVLICQRKAGQLYAGKWEFPGGKVEPLEELTAALKRELMEELAITVTIGEEIASYEYTYPGRPLIQLVFYKVSEFEGEPRNLIFEQIRWEKIENLSGYDFLDGDIDFVRNLTRESLSRPG